MQFLRRLVTVATELPLLQEEGEAAIEKIENRIKR
jgi:hypothetical protein